VTFELVLGALISAWAIGFVLGYKLKMIFDALNAC